MQFREMATNEGNSFGKVDIGINGRNLVNPCTLTILGNEFDNSDPFDISHQGRFANTAINIQNPILGFSSITEIYGNTIYDFRIGIHASNLNNLRIGTDISDNPNPNKIHFHLGAEPDMTDYHAGIWIQGCDNAFITGEGEDTAPDIDNDEPVALTNVEKFIGIDIENSIETRINCNVISKISNSIYFKGHCENSLMRLNYLNEFEIGVNNYFSYLGPVQGFYNISTGFFEKLDNEWHDLNNDNRVGGILSTTDWYWKTGYTEFKPEPNQGFVNAISTSNGSPICGDYTSLIRDFQFGQIVGDSLRIEQNENENIYLSKLYAFQELCKDTSILTQGRSSDFGFHAFYNELDSSNISKFLKIKSWSCDSNYFHTASEMLDSITIVNDIEENELSFYNLYLNYILNGDTLSELDSTTLMTIANKNWIEAGNSIYWSAANLDLEIHPNVEALRIKTHYPQNLEQNNPIINRNINIYPNPANSHIFVELTKGDYDLKIYNNIQQLVFQQKIHENCSINLLNLNNGVYYVTIHSNEQVFNFNLIIMHD